MESKREGIATRNNQILNNYLFCFCYLSIYNGLLGHYNCSFFFGVCVCVWCPRICSVCLHVCTGQWWMSAPSCTALSFTYWDGTLQGIPNSPTWLSSEPTCSREPVSLLQHRHHNGAATPTWLCHGAGEQESGPQPAQQALYLPSYLLAQSQCS